MKTMDRPVAERHDYDRIGAALAWLAEHYAEQPPLGRVAAEVGLSEFHFQRLFSDWVGLSPKRYVQVLTLAQARACLAASGSVLDAAFESGLSGPGRLHDLFVRLEAMTPGEYKARGAGVEIRHGLVPSPFGECLLMHTARGICGLAFVEPGDRDGALADLSRGWERATFVEDRARTAALAARVFATDRAADDAPLRVLVRGTAFQVKVWEALMAIAPGEVASYETLARRVGSPRAVRAVASASASNAVAWLIPCHRVIRKSGALGGYRWGLGRKLALLSWEAARHAAASEGA